MERNDFLNVQEQKNRVYLVPETDGAWSAVVSADKPSHSVVLLTQEGDYPVNLYYSRLDMNGSSCLERETIADRKSLLETLNWIGQCRHFPKVLWEFDAGKPISKELVGIFNASYDSRMKQIKLELAELDEIEKAFSAQEGQKEPLDTQIHRASVRASGLQFTDNTLEKGSKPER